MLLVMGAKMAHLVAMGTSLGRERMARRLTRMRYWVIFVRRCLFLCTKNLGQYASCSSICARALAYSPLSLQSREHPQLVTSAAVRPQSMLGPWTKVAHLIFCQSWFGECALSMLFKHKYSLPFSSRIVAYLELARGQELLLQRPVTLFSFRQKF